jgi:hypothetical protein|tara:strand:+ start:536 stop:751 length:216 start_codon:yes stop_codon:yes gene_type:complete
MKFLYVDVIETNVVSIFKTETGEILKLSAKDVTEQKKKHALLGSYEARAEFDDALSAMGQYKQAKPWWKFW